MFIVSTGRSGSTVFGRTVAKHESLAYLTTLSDRYPDKPWVSRFVLHGSSLPLMGQLLRRKLPPSEAYTFWEHYAKGFRRPARDLRSSDVTEYQRRAVKNALAQVLTRRRNRFMAKLTGWPRIGFLNEIFPDAVFVHLVRDGRDVVNSILKVGFWEGWRGPYNWRLGELPESFRDDWERHDRSFLILAAIYWKLTVRAVHDAAGALPAERFCEFRYEDFTRDPQLVMRQVAYSTGLPWTRSFERQVQRTAVRDANGKYRRDLTASQRMILEDYLAPDLKALGYH